MDTLDNHIEGRLALITGASGGLVHHISGNMYL